MGKWLKVVQICEFSRDTPTPMSRLPFFDSSKVEKTHPFKKDPLVTVSIDV